MFHPILRRQLRKLGLKPEEPPTLEAWLQLLERVNGSYQSADLDRYTLERSLSLSSGEMRELTQRLQLAMGQLNKLSMTDELTGLMNRRFLNVTIHEEVSQVIRHYRNLLQGNSQRITSNLDLAFLMVDIDHFKGVNDSYGHSAGDQVIVQVCQLLRDACRDTDTIVRWGGEEFLVVARNLNPSGLGMLCERIRQKVALHPFHVRRPEPLHLTCSIGATAFPFLGSASHALGWDQVVELADTCLYAAKRSGRNAWVRIGSTERTSILDLGEDLNREIPALIAMGKLEVQTNLPEQPPLNWPN